MANRKEEKERLRQIRIEAEKKEAAEQRRKVMLGYGVAGLFGLVILGAIVFVLLSSGGDGGQAHVSSQSGNTNGVALDERTGTQPAAPQETDLAKATKAANCDLMENLADEGNRHIAPGSSTPDYKTNPPTSGPHVQPPFQQADGAYSEMPVTINFVHSMEHGRVEIQYSPSLAEADQKLLKGLYDQQYSGALLFPNGDMPYAVAETAWRNLIGCKKWEGAKTIDALRAFGAKHFGHGPESTFGTLSGPNAANPDLNAN